MSFVYINKPMTITIREVASKKDLKKFVKFPNKLYAGNPYYVPQIESMDRDTLDPNVNRAFEVAEGKYWLAYDSNGEIVGRIAGIINHRYNEKIGEKTCRFGWIDFIDSAEVSKALLDTVEQYALSKGMTSLSGPYGFLEFDVSGVLVEGFDQLPTPYGKYNAPYYEQHILACGYSRDTDYVEYHITVPEVIPERYFKFADIVSEKYELHEAPLRKHSDLLKYGDGIFKCMNSCYNKLHGYSELSKGQCDDLIKQFFPNLHIDFASIILDKNNQVVAFGIGLPSLAKAMQKANGSLFPFGFIHILRALKKNDTMDALLIAINDEYKDKGLNSMIFKKIAHTIQKYNIKYVESTRELEENTSVQNLWGRFDRVLNKRARTYIKRF